MPRDSYTIDRDLGESRILEVLRQAEGASVEAGIFANEEHPEGDTEYTLAEIGAVHEFGTKPGTTPRIPERSWMRRTLNEHPDLDDDFNDAMVRAAMGKTSTLAALTAFGEMVAGEMKQTITDVKEPPKAEATLEREGPGFTNPLIWTGSMRAAVRSRITVRGLVKMTAKGR